MQIPEYDPKDSDLEYALVQDFPQTICGLLFILLPHHMNSDIGNFSDLPSLLHELNPATKDQDFTE